ncbi:MOS1T transposase, partial [Pseudoatta argentina]
MVTCRDWFRRFKNNDFEPEDKGRSGAPELEQLLDEDPSQTLSEFGKILQVDESTVSKRLKGLGMIEKQGHWVPYELNGRKKRFFASHRIVTGDEKWIHYDNPKRRKSWGKPGHASTSSAKPNIHGSNHGSNLPHPPYSPDIAPSDFHWNPFTPTDETSEMASSRNRKGEMEGDGSYASIGKRSVLPGNRDDFFRSV